MNDSDRRIACFGPFRLSAATREIERNGVPVALGDRSLDLLIALVERAGEIVSQRELASRVWRGLVVSPGCLRVHMSALRKALGCGRDGARYIKNVIGQGYCFVAPVVRGSYSAMPATGPSDIARKRVVLPSKPFQREERNMKIVVIGGSGLIESRLVSLLRNRGHEVFAAAPDSGVNTITGEGLDAALAGAQVVVDVANSPTFDEASIQFFETSGTHLLAAEARAGVQHHVALSIVGTDRVPDSAYLRAKVVQENLIIQSGIPYSILRSTQFFEFIGHIAQGAAGANSVRVSSALFQPILSADVVAALADITVGRPLNAIVEIGGPERFRIDDLVRRVLQASGDEREVVADAHARYFGSELDDQSLVAGPSARVGAKHFDEWLRDSAVQRRG